MLSIKIHEDWVWKLNQKIQFSVPSAGHQNCLDKSLTRIKEPLKTDKSCIHINICHQMRTVINSSTDDCFFILDYASTKYQLKIKEALYIKQLDPILNKQKKTFKIRLYLWVGIYFFTIILFHFSCHLQVILQLGLIIYS